MTLSALEEQKQHYQSIPVPEELLGRVQGAVFAGRKAARKKRITHLCAKLGTAAAAACFVLAINLSAPFARAMQGLPVLGPVFKVVTFRDYNDDQGNYSAQVYVPQILNEDPSTPLDDCLKQMNQALAGYAQGVIDQYQQDLALSGGQGHESVYSDFQVLHDSDRLLSIAIRTDISMASTNSFVKIYHLDKASGRMLELSDLFVPGSDYVSRLSGLVIEQMRQRMAQDESQAYFIDGGVDIDFERIRGDQSFYIDADGDLVLVFDKYEAAPGYMGVVEFTIPRAQIQDLLSPDAPLLSF